MVAKMDLDLFAPYGRARFLLFRTEMTLVSWEVRQKMNLRHCAESFSQAYDGLTPREFPFTIESVLATRHSLRFPFDMNSEHSLN